MGINYMVMQLNPEMLSWALECDVPVSDVAPDGRAANLDELIACVSELPGHGHSSTTREQEFFIDVESEEKMLFPVQSGCKNLVAPGVAEYSESWVSIEGALQPDGSIGRMWYHGDLDLVVLIAQGLTRTCGPQLYYSDCEGIPWIISSPEAAPIGPDSE